MAFGEKGGALVDLDIISFKPVPTYAREEPVKNALAEPVTPFEIPHHTKGFISYLRSSLFLLVPSPLSTPLRGQFQIRLIPI